MVQVLYPKTSEVKKTLAPGKDAREVPDVMRAKPKKLNPAEQDIVSFIKHSGNALADNLKSMLPECRDRSLALTHLEDCIMRAVRAATAQEEV